MAGFTLYGYPVACIETKVVIPIIPYPVWYTKPMQRLALIARHRLQYWRYRYDHRNDPPPVIVPPLNEDLNGLTMAELTNELSAVRRRRELGHVEPEGEAGLRYRESRLVAQIEALKRKGRMV
jgi:hypothetical protein